MLINDGTGGGHVAKVTKDNRLAVDSGGAMTDASIANKGWAFSNYRVAETITVTGTGGYMFILSNTSTSTVIVEDVTVSTNTAGTAYHSWVGAAKGTLGNSTSISASPLNAAATGLVAPVTVDVWSEASDGITGITGGSPVTSAILGVGTVTVDSGGGVVIPPGGTFVGKLKGGSECTFVVRFYEAA